MWGEAATIEAHRAPMGLGTTIRSAHAGDDDRIPNVPAPDAQDQVGFAGQDEATHGRRPITRPVEFTRNCHALTTFSSLGQLLGRQTTAETSWAGEDCKSVKSTNITATTNSVRTVEAAEYLLDRSS